MYKGQLIERASKELSLRNKDLGPRVVGEVLDTILRLITDTVAARETVTISGFGTFEYRDIAERPGMNPKTKERIMIAARGRMGFSEGQLTKDAMHLAWRRAQRSKAGTKAAPVVAKPSKSVSAKKAEAAAPPPAKRAKSSKAAATVTAS